MSNIVTRTRKTKTKSGSTVWQRFPIYEVQQINIKARAHSFKRFTSRLLKLSFSLYAPITSDECHA